MNKLREFVNANEKWFRGRLPETDASLDKVEEELSIKIPTEIRWLLKEYGYWHGTGISNIEESIIDTKEARKHVGLPAKFLVLYDHQDGGVVLLDTIANPITGEFQVYDTAWESIPDNLENEIIYSNYVEYVKRVIEVESEVIDEGDIECTE